MATDPVAARGGPASIEGIRIDEELVRALLAEQFPQWSSLPLRRIAAGGNDHRMLRLGDRMCVRLPSAPGYVAQVGKEQAWLPRLAASVPLPIPVVRGRGRPSARFPAPWSVYGWLEGEPASTARIDDAERFAADLAHVLVALRTADTTGAPPPGEHSAFRGGPLQHWHDEMQDLLLRVHGRDRDGAAGIWRDALAARDDAERAWFHGDVSTSNLLVREGALAAVIDFGCAGVGDTACDTVILWTHLHGSARDVFRRELGVDEATWARGRGWAVWKALIMWSSPLPEQAALARRVLARLLAET